MRFSRRVIPVPLAVVCAWGAPAQAAVPHVVGPGETLWSIAAANNFRTDAFAAANGLSPEAHVILGTTIQVPSEPEAAAALTGTGPPVGAAPAAATSPVPAAAAATPAEAPAPAAPPAGAPAPLGSYTVEPGDSLSAIAARSGASIEQVAAANGLDPAAPLLSGTALKLPTGSAPAQVASPPPQRVPEAAPYPTANRISAEEVKQVAAGHGIPPDLAAAVAWQESGFNNAAVSSANARGVMQILPGTWDWVQENLARERLDPASPHDNVHAGAMYLGQLARDTGGDLPTAVAAYYQGLTSVREDGLLPETQRYVDNVMALRSRFGGP